MGRRDVGDRDPEHQALTAKISSGEATDADRERFRELHRSRARMVLETDPDEATMETRIRLLDGRELCPPCFDTVLATK